MKRQQQERKPHNLLTADLQRIFSVSRRTALDWCRKGIPAHLAHAAAALGGGSLDALSREWAGWHVIAGHLVSPEGWSFRPGEVRALPLMREQIREYQRQQRFAQQADWIDGNWKAEAPRTAPANKPVTALAEPAERFSAHRARFSRSAPSAVPNGPAAQ